MGSGTAAVAVGFEVEVEVDVEVAVVGAVVVVVVVAVGVGVGVGVVVVVVVAVVVGVELKEYLAMSLFKTRLSNQGGVLVKRDDKGEVVQRGVPVPGAKPRVNVRHQLRQLTRGGMDQAETLYNIAQGHPWRAELPDGSTTDWIVPTTAERAQAAQWLWEIQNGKAVPQTEVVKADEAGDERERLQAMSDEALIEAASQYLERVKKPEEK